MVHPRRSRGGDHSNFVFTRPELPQSGSAATQRTRCRQSGVGEVIRQ
jgi:hypothetical protein